MQGFLDINLRFFDGEGVGAPAAGGTETAPAEQVQAPVKQTGKRGKKNALADVQYGKAPEAEEPIEEAPKTQSEPEPEEPVKVDRQAEFEKLIKGDYKDLFAQRTQQIIDSRFKDYKALESQKNSITPVMEALAIKYGVNDPQELLKAIEEDNAYFEQEAAKRGYDAEEFKRIRKLETEYNQMKMTIDEQTRAQEAAQVMQRWTEQAETLKGMYPAFDLQAESSHPETGERFRALLRNGIDVKTAYEVIHKDDIIGGAMHYTAEQVTKKVTDNIRARGLRPTENGTSGNAPAVIRKSDPRTFTRKDREEISRRVLRGENITF